MAVRRANEEVFDTLHGERRCRWKCDAAGNFGRECMQRRKFRELFEKRFDL
jgi:hypothetical protein